jgi:hypothetical protein
MSTEKFLESLPLYPSSIDFTSSGFTISTPEASNKAGFPVAAKAPTEATEKELLNALLPSKVTELGTPNACQF